MCQYYCHLLSRIVDHLFVVVLNETPPTLQNNTTCHCARFSFLILHTVSTALVTYHNKYCLWIQTRAVQITYILPMNLYMYKCRLIIICHAILLVHSRPHFGEIYTTYMSVYRQFVSLYSCLVHTYRMAQVEELWQWRHHYYSLVVWWGMKLCFTVVAPNSAERHAREWQVSILKSLFWLDQSWKTVRSVVKPATFRFPNLPQWQADALLIRPFWLVPLTCNSTVYIIVYWLDGMT